MSLLIKGGRVLDPESKTDQTADVLIEGERIKEIAPTVNASADETIDASGKWVIPGLVDIHVHLREPGEEYKEDIESGSKAAAAGGVTTMVAMPNTKPVIDTAEVVAFVKRRGEEVGLCRVLPSGATTVGQKSQALAPFAEMKHAGAVALTDDGHPVQDAALMRNALEYSQDFDLPVLTHAEELALSAGGDMHEGDVSTRLGLRGIPRTAEDVAIARDIALAALTGGHLHVCHISTAGGVEMVRRAKKEGVRVTAEAAPHHFTLTHSSVEGFNTSAKMAPPLREDADKMAVIEGLRDGTIEAIATDHAPHGPLEKDVAFSDAANGVLGLQTSLPLSLDLWRNHNFDVLTVVKRLSSGPAALLGLPYGRLQVGAHADVVVVDPNAKWTYDAAANLSKSDNSPFLNRELQGKVELTVLEGRVVHRA